MRDYDITEDTLVDLGAVSVETKGPLPVALIEDGPGQGYRDTPAGLSEA